MKKYLTISKNFKTKKYFQSKSKSIIKIHIPNKLHKLIKQKHKKNIPKTLQKTIYKKHITYKHNILYIPFSIFKTFFQKTINNITKFIKKILTKTNTKNIIIINKFTNYKIIQQSILKNFKTYLIIIPPNPKFIILKNTIYFNHIQNTTSFHISYYSFKIKINQQFNSIQNKNNKQINIKTLSHNKTNIYPLIKYKKKIKLNSKYNFSHFLKTNLKKIIYKLYISNQKYFTYTYKKNYKFLNNLLIQLPSKTNIIKIKKKIIFNNTKIIFKITLNSNQIFKKSFNIFNKKYFPNF